MGCTVTKAENSRSNLLTRINAYQKESSEYLNDLVREPTSLLPENFRDGYISPANFFNLFHAGFCAPYIANENYMLLVDFRTKEEYDESHLLTAVHYESIPWEKTEYLDLCLYTVIVFYDYDGTAAANIYSTLHRAFKRMKKEELEILCILGGIKRVCDNFPHLISRPADEHARSNGHAHGHAHFHSRGHAHHRKAPARQVIPWMPTHISKYQVYLGRHEQAEEMAVIRDLRLTHILSIGRSPENRYEGVSYEGLDGETDLFETFRNSYRLINSVIEKGGCILIHGVDGLNRSAAVVMAYLMRATPCLLEEAYFYLQVLRPFIRLDDHCLECLLKYEEFLFGSSVTEIDELWF